MWNDCAAGCINRGCILTVLSWHNINVDYDTASSRTMVNSLIKLCYFNTLTGLIIAPPSLNYSHMFGIKIAPGNSISNGGMKLGS